MAPPRRVRDSVQMANGPTIKTEPSDDDNGLATPALKVAEDAVVEQHDQGGAGGRPIQQPWIGISEALDAIPTVNQTVVPSPTALSNTLSLAMRPKQSRQKGATNAPSVPTPTPRALSKRNENLVQPSTLCFSFNYINRPYHHALGCGHEVTTEQIQPCGPNCKLSAKAEEKTQGTLLICKMPGCIWAKKKPTNIFIPKNRTGRAATRGRLQTPTVLQTHSNLKTPGSKRKRDDVETIDFAGDEEMSGRIVSPYVKKRRIATPPPDAAVRALIASAAGPGVTTRSKMPRLGNAYAPSAFNSKEMRELHIDGTAAFKDKAPRTFEQARVAADVAGDSRQGKEQVSSRKVASGFSMPEQMYAEMPEQQGYTVEDDGGALGCDDSTSNIGGSYAAPQLHCICLAPSDNTMVECTSCEGWFHLQCVGKPEAWTVTKVADRNHRGSGMRTRSRISKQLIKQCDGCGERLDGERHSCAICLYFDFCATCRITKRDAHDLSHPFVIISADGEQHDEPFTCQRCDDRAAARIKAQEMFGKTGLAQIRAMVAKNHARRKEQEEIYQPAFHTMKRKRMMQADSEDNIAHKKLRLDDTALLHQEKAGEGSSHVSQSSTPPEVHSRSKAPAQKTSVSSQTPVPTRAKRTAEMLDRNDEPKSVGFSAGKSKQPLVAETDEAEGLRWLRSTRVRPERDANLGFM